MNLISWRTWRLGFKSLMLHPMRSLLTVLGIFVGVCSVIWLLAIGEGISVKTQEQIASLGAENIIIRTMKPAEDAGSSTTGSFTMAYGLTRKDYEILLRTLDTVKSALPIRELRARFAYRTRAFEGRLVGCTAEYAEVNQLHMAKGHFLTDSEIATQSNVCVLAHGTAQRLFSYEDPIGESVRVEDQYYTVVGVTENRNPTAGVGGSLSAQDYNDDIYIPITTLRMRIGDQVTKRSAGSFSSEIVELSQITLRVHDVRHVLETADLVKRTLARHHLAEDYAVVVPFELLEQARVTKLLFMVFMGLIAAISLVVGGIGIMNIMLATVTERTREIGIRRALGARRSDIVMQFLVETVVLSVAGGITGILGGLTCRPTINFFRGVLETRFADVVSELPDVFQSVEPILVPESIPLSFVISVMIGVVFGIYPAIRAAQMHPVEALRHE